jgi:cytochrome P450
MCIKEALRLHTPVSVVQRQTTSELEADGCTLPVGSYVFVNIYNLHHNPLVWEDDMEYRPDRFLPENTKGRDAYAFVPFSAGPR